MPRVVFEVIDYSVSKSGTWGGTLSYLFICPYSTRIIRDGSFVTTSPAIYV
jgi:hypothetical protein